MDHLHAEVIAPSKVRKKLASSSSLSLRETEDTPNAKIVHGRGREYFGTIRWVPSLLNNLAPADAERRKPRWSPRSKRGFILREGGPRWGWRCLVQRNAGTARPSAYSGQSGTSSRVRDILLHVARTWTRLAIEAEEWGRRTDQARLKSSVRKCTERVNAANPTSASRFEARAALVES